MDDRVAPIVMIVLAGGAGLVVLLVASLRWVAPGQLLVVTRRGRVARVRGDGLTVRVPVLEQVRYVDVEPHPELVTVRARTADGAELRLLLVAHVARAAPRRGSEYAEPGPAVAHLIGERLEPLVVQYPLSELPAVLPALLRGCVEAADVVLREHRVRLLRLEVDAVEHLLVSPTVPSTGRTGVWTSVG